MSLGRCLIVLAMAAFLLGACAPKAVIPHPPEPIDTSYMTLWRCDEYCSAPEEPVYRNEVWRLEINFAFDQSDIRPGEDQALARFADFLNQHPEITAVEIAGHTCSLGPAAYNRQLSQRRAESVVSYLVEKLGVDPRRLTARGYGLTRPIVDNRTEEGRRRNRRVEALATARITR